MAKKDLQLMQTPPRSWTTAMQTNRIDRAAIRVVGRTANQVSVKPDAKLTRDQSWAAVYAELVFH